MLWVCLIVLCAFSYYKKNYNKVLTKDIIYGVKLSEQEKNSAYPMKGALEFKVRHWKAQYCNGDAVLCS